MDELLTAWEKMNGDIEIDERTIDSFQSLADSEQKFTSIPLDFSPFVHPSEDPTSGIRTFEIAGMNYAFTRHTARRTTQAQEPERLP